MVEVTWPVSLLSAVLLFGCVSSNAAAPPPVGQTRANCASPVYATDILVCGDAELRLLDDRIAMLWEAKARAPSFVESEERAQTAWLRQRSLCAFRADHRSCALMSYRSRISALQAGISSP